MASATTTTTPYLTTKSILLSVVLAFLLTPFPKQWGIYRGLGSIHPFFVGLFPFTIPSEDDWGFTFYDLYGLGPHGDSDKGRAREYRRRLWGQTAIVTGANSGIGYEIALALARLGVEVTLACRSPTRCLDAAQSIANDPSFAARNISAKVSIGTVDLSSLQSVKKFSLDYLERSKSSSSDENESSTLKPLDMLFLNAGIPDAAPNPDGSLKLSEDGIEQVFATNVVGHHLLYKLLEPVIRHPSRTTPARIVQTSSCMSFLRFFPFRIATDLETLNGVWPYMNMGSYPHSKLAQILWTQELTAQLDADVASEETSNPNAIVYANAGNPGAVASDIWKLKDWEGGIALRRRLATLAVKIIHSLFWTSAEGALTLLYLGTAVEDLQAKKIRGQYFHPQSQPITDHYYARKQDPQTKILREALWKFLDELVADFL